MARTKWLVSIDFIADKGVSVEDMDQFFRSADKLFAGFMLYNHHEGIFKIYTHGATAAAVATAIQPLNDILDRILDDDVRFNTVVIDLIGVDNES